MLLFIIKLWLNEFNGVKGLRSHIFGLHFSLSVFGLVLMDVVSISVIQI